MTAPLHVTLTMLYVGKDRARNHGELGRDERARMALMAHIGKWNCEQVAEVYGVSRHAVYRARSSWQPIERNR